MADHLYLSLWVKGFALMALPSYLEKVLRVFPFSRLQPDVVFRVRAISFSEPPVVERIMPDGASLDEIVTDASELLHADSAFEVECFWEMWQWEGDWSLKPSRVEIGVYGPEFEADGEHIRLDLGPETLFLPPASSEKGLTPVQSNLRSVLRLVDDLGKTISIERRSLWSDSGENFADRLADTL